MNKDIVLFGIQGSGKGTQAKMFLNEYSNYKYLEPGQVFRALTSNSNVISDYMKDTMSQGKMLDDNLAFDLFMMYFHLLEADQYMLTDGFPRTMPQMHFFLSEEAKNKRDYVGIYFEIDRELCIERILQRAKEQNRADDLDINIINKRMDVFEQETMPIIKYFNSIGKLITINANQTVDKIYSDLVSALKSM